MNKRRIYDLAQTRLFQLLEMEKNIAISYPDLTSKELLSLYENELQELQMMIEKI